MPTLILSPRYSPDSQALWKAALSQGWSVERLHGYRPPEWLKDQQPVIYGEAVFARIIAQSLSLELLQTPLSWLADLPPEFLRRSVQYTTLENARNLKEPAFIKPAGEKSFEAKTYPSGESLPVSEVGFPESTPVLVSEPVQWEIEFRCFILDRQLLTLSIYKREGQLAEPGDENWPASQPEIKHASDFCRTLIENPMIRMPPAFVVDIGIIKGMGWAVIETNPAWASGIYGCDAGRILPVIQRACVDSRNLSSSDEGWVL